jgi:putative transposase
MTEPTIAFTDYLRNTGLDLDAGFLREAITLMTQLLMEAEVSERIGADRYERSEARQAHRNGYRGRFWETRVGDIPLRIPKLRRGSYFPSFLEPRRRAEKALLAVIQTAYVQGVSTRKVDQLVQSLGLEGMDKSRVSRICKELDEAVDSFRQRPLGGAYPYVWLDALYLKVRQNHRIVSMALVIAIGVRETGEREILGLEIGASEEEAFWTAFLRGLVGRGLKGVKLVLSDAHQGLQQAIGAVLVGAAWQRCSLPLAAGVHLHAQRAGACAQRGQVHRGGRYPDHLRSAQRGSSPTTAGGSGGGHGLSLAPGGGGAGRGRGGGADLHELPGGALDPHLLHQSAGAAQQGGEATDQRRGHLSQH